MEDAVKFLSAFYRASHAWEAGVRALLDYGQRTHPSVLWPPADDLLERAVEEFNSFRAWLQTEPRGSSVAVAYYFGITEDGAAVCLFARAAFDAADVQCTWANGGRLLGREWVDSRVLDRFGLLSELLDSGFPILLYVLCLGYVGLLVQHCAADFQRRPVAVGFLDGDSFLVLDASPS